MSNSAQQLFGRLNVLSKLGSGAQGTVYLADDPVLERKVAIKVLTATDPAMARTHSNGALLEGRIASKLNHPNIVSVYDAGDSRIGPYLVFEFVEGKTLADTLESHGPFSIRNAVTIIAPILDALATAHRLQIVHLDLSPRNILIDANGVPRIMDFGLSRFLRQIPQKRKHVAGTLRYMAPEHFTGNAIGPHTDVFALGSTFLELVTGQRAMDGDSIVDIRRRIVDACVDYSGLNALQAGSAYEQLLRGSLTRDIAERYPDCGVMQGAFRVFVRDAELEEAVADDAAQHSTVEYLLRRMRKKKDFPTISRTLADINRLTGDNSGASADAVANVILRDFALTGKLLKLVNSSFYGTRSAEITSISQAVVHLGLEQVRLTANSLSFFGHMKGEAKDVVLKNAMTKSFLSGLIARHLARHERLPEAEEAFICGMFQRLGETLVIYYFREEYDEIIEVAQRTNTDRQAASQSVLGIDYATLGTAVATTWQLPDTLLAAIAGIANGPLLSPETPDERLRDFAVFANELCDLAALPDFESQQQQLHALLHRFSPSVSLNADLSVKLLSAGLEKLEQYSQLFEINVATSDYCRAVRNWIDHRLTNESNSEQAATTATSY